MGYTSRTRFCAGLTCTKERKHLFFGSCPFLPFFLCFICKTRKQWRISERDDPWRPNIWKHKLATIFSDKRRRRYGIILHGNVYKDIHGICSIYSSAPYSLSGFSNSSVAIYTALSYWCIMHVCGLWGTLIDKRISCRASFLWQAMVVLFRWIDHGFRLVIDYWFMICQRRVALQLFLLNVIYCDSLKGCVSFMQEVWHIRKLGNRMYVILLWFSIIKLLLV